MPGGWARWSGSSSHNLSDSVSAWRREKRAVIQQLVIAFLHRGHGNVAHAAEIAEVDPKNFRENMRRYGVRVVRDGGPYRIVTR